MTVIITKADILAAVKPTEDQIKADGGIERWRLLNRAICSCGHERLHHCGTTAPCSLCGCREFDEE
jgi:hypothetical protein